MEGHDVTVGSRPASYETLHGLCLCLVVAALAVLNGWIVANVDDLIKIGMLLALQAVLLLSHYITRRSDHLLVALVVAISMGGLGGLAEGEGRMTVLPIVTLAVGALWFVRTCCSAGGFVRFRELKWLVIYAVAAIVASVFGADWGNSYRTVGTTLKLILLLFVVVQLVRNADWAYAMGWWIIAGVSFAAGFSLVVPILGISVPGFEASEFLTQEGTIIRVGGMHGGSNNFSVMLVVGSGFAAAYLRRKQFRPVLLVCLSVMTVANAMTVSLTGLASMLVVVGLIVTQVYRTRKIRDYFILVVVGAALFGSVWVLHQPSRDRVYDKIEQMKTQESGYWFSSRVGIHAGALEVIWRYPVLGVGLKNGLYFIPQYWTLKTGQDRRGAHNSFLSVACDIGLPGAVAFMAVALGSLGGLYSILSSSRSKSRPGFEVKSKYDSVAVATFVSLFVIIFIGGVFQSLERVELFWLLMGMGIALRLQYNASDHPSHQLLR